MHPRSALLIKGPCLSRVCLTSSPQVPDLRARAAAAAGGGTGASGAGCNSITSNIGKAAVTAIDVDTSAEEMAVKEEVVKEESDEDEQEMNVAPSPTTAALKKKIDDAAKQLHERQAKKSAKQLHERLAEKSASTNSTVSVDSLSRSSQGGSSKRPSDAELEAARVALVAKAEEAVRVAASAKADEEARGGGGGEG